MTENDLSSVLGARRYQNTRLRTGLASLNLEVVDRDHGAVEQLLLPVSGANAQPVAAHDLQWRGCSLVFRPPAYDHRHPVRIGPFPIRQGGETTLPHQVRQRPHFGSCARQHHAGFVGMFPLVAVPVIDQTGQRLFFVVPDMKPAPCVVSRYGRCRVAIAQRFRCSASDTCHGVNTGLSFIASYSATMRVRSCSPITPVRNRTASGFSPWT